ncbi:MAG: hypothetical protein CBB68_08770 [Rhodospirillaceae bacterium TMED8]|nr:MAG: hypothetical protein CBB68_08770 [Rhodospirillaceae bacterium TMED8]
MGLRLICINFHPLITVTTWLQFMLAQVSLMACVFQEIFCFNCDGIKQRGPGTLATCLNGGAFRKR